MTAPTPGTVAPAFSLLASSGDAGEQQVSLTEKDFRGRPLILAFYPADWSPVCGDQMVLYNAALPEFERLGAAILGVSVDGAFCHQAFARDRPPRGLGGMGRQWRRVRERQGGSYQERKNVPKTHERSVGAGGPTGAASRTCCGPTYQQRDARSRQLVTRKS